MSDLVATGEFDVRAVYDAIDEQRRARGRSPQSACFVNPTLSTGEILRGFTPGSLTNLASGGRTGFPGVMRLVLSLSEPAALFTRVAAW